MNLTKVCLIYFGNIFQVPGLLHHSVSIL